ncbi:C4-dicarboxylate ABC transporter permease [Vibrio sp. UCD-FRSSP16_10]|uniref:TRAP transporter small permease n=1 Tax=unclassified Vibrio TaxID=2614977 RepID=UPI0007FFDDAA|nr:MULTISPECIES: TRAP transporter small permease [unclassified Vibrio]OBT17038.1 C4-dicarboxylate ABC transporter permease [Vibrio sp. UCD-FRSSP16_30]OBT22029.1 C4-dicarboxylate ABC transporter permease [Vibrio sp. UCD-FRSSP16_10]
MYSVLRQFKTILDKAILTFCGVAIVTLVITVTWQVFSRYVLNDPSSFTDELARYTMIWFGLAGASYLFGKNGHLSITLFIGSVKTKHRKYVHVLINLVSVVFISLAMVKGGLLLMSRTMTQFSPALQIPMAYVYLILPLSGAIMLTYIALNSIEVFAPTQSAKEGKQ